MFHAAVEAPVRIHPILPMSQPRRCAPIPPLDGSCSSCRVRSLCLPSSLGNTDMQRLDELKLPRRKIRSGQSLYRQGERSQFIHAVRSGTFKSSQSLSDGREQIAAFTMAGELMGFDGVAEGWHAVDATALEDSEVCTISHAQLAELAAASSSAGKLLSNLMSREIVRQQGQMMLLGSMNATERVAGFLLNLSRRLTQRGYSATDFILRMTRAEIGSYLGLKLETVSRTFSALHLCGLLKVEQRHIRILDLDGLARVFETRLQ